MMDYLGYQVRPNGGYSAHFGGWPAGIRGNVYSSAIRSHRKLYTPKNIADAIVFLDVHLLQHTTEKKRGTILKWFMDRYQEDKKTYDRTPEKLAELVQSTIRKHKTEEIMIKILFG